MARLSNKAARVVWKRVLLTLASSQEVSSTSSAANDEEAGLHTLVTGMPRRQQQECLRFFLEWQENKMMFRVLHPVGQQRMERCHACHWMDAARAMHDTAVVPAMSMLPRPGGLALHAHQSQ